MSVQISDMVELGVTDGVSRIIDSLVGSLLLNPDRTFTLAGMVGIRFWRRGTGRGERGRAGEKGGDGGRGK
jgi:hypothetical protein